MLADGVPAISKHQKNIFEEMELEITTVSKMEIVVNRNFELYNLFEL